MSDESFDLSSRPLGEVLIALGETGRDVDVVVESARGPARLRISQGRIIDAECLGQSGRSALEAVLSLEEGMVSIEPTGVREGPLALDVEDALRVWASERAPVTDVGIGPMGFATNRTVIGPFGANSISPKTIHGFPPNPRLRRALQDSDRPRTAAIAGDKPRPTGRYSSTPPPSLAEEVIRMPRARVPSELQSSGEVERQASAGRGEGGAQLRERRAEPTDGSPRPASKSDAPPSAPSNPVTIGRLADRRSAPREDEGDRPSDVVPVSSLELDQRSLASLESLNEHLSATNHAPPEPPPELEPAAPRIPTPPRPIVAVRDPSSAMVELPPAAELPAEAEAPASAPSKERSSDAPPSLPRVGRYEVLARLKSGGMGSVYLCRLSGSAGFQRLFAMKVLHQNLAPQKDMLAAFFREARLLAQLHHPNIVGIVDVGSPDQPFLVLDYVEGGSLQELLDSSREERSPAVVTAVILDALNGLSAVHGLTDASGRQLELVHNDISPHNLLVGVDGACRVTDFGIAYARDGSSEDVPTRGKPSYIAPERILGQRVDHRADIFSMGVVLYSALTGVDPFMGDSVRETLDNVLNRPIAPPSEVGLRPPPSFDWVCMRALARNPAERFQSAEDMALQLRRIVGREDLLVAPSVVASWVKSSLAGTIEARRAAVSRGLAPVGRSSRPSGPGSTAPGARIGSDPPPPSSVDFSDRTEVLDEAAEDVRERTDTTPPEDGRRRVLYVAIGLAAAAVLFVALFPELVSGTFRETSTTPRLTTDEAFELSKERALRETERPADDRADVRSGDAGAEKNPAESDQEQERAVSPDDTTVVLPPIRPRGHND